MNAARIGRPTIRKEDSRLLQGLGRFTDDLRFEGQSFAAFLRSPHAHAEIIELDASEALAVPGVIGVVTGKTLAAANIAPLTSESELRDRAGAQMFKPPRPALAVDRVRYVGEPVAMVVAENMEAASSALEAIHVDYAPLPAIVDPLLALADGAPLVWPERLTNAAICWESGSPDEADDALARAHTIVKVDLINNRLAPSPMEPRCASAEYDPVADRITLYAPTQGGRRIQTTLAKQIFKMERDKIRVVSYDTGGGFGTRAKLYPELVVICWAARAFGRPVKWLGDRSETFLADCQGRGQVNHAEAGFDVDGRMIGLKIATVLSLGAHLVENAPRLPINGGGRIIPCAYDVQAFHFSVTPVFTNTIPTESYRGAGRPEANFLMERLMDVAAAEMGASRIDVRRRNLIAASRLPYTSKMGVVIDSGDFVGIMEAALQKADWDGFPSRRAASRERGRLRGIGFSCFIEGSGARPIEEMRVAVQTDGSVIVFAGTYSQGQGHETVYSQLVTDWLGAPMDKVFVRQGDTDEMPEKAVGTFGSRTSMMGGVCLKRACDDLIAKGRVVAARLLQADPSAIGFSDGRFFSNASGVSLAEVARAVAEEARASGSDAGFGSSYVYSREGEECDNFPNGCHVCEVEIEIETGCVSISSYTAVDDCGAVLNPILVHGQLHGGIVQGLGQALMEQVIYDASGQLMTGSFVDYAMPRAEDVPSFHVDFRNIPCQTNDLGVKGVGEAGTCGAPGAAVSAIVDALRPLGVTHIDMPVTAAKIWRLIRNAPVERSVLLQHERELPAAALTGAYPET